MNFEIRFTPEAEETFQSIVAQLRTRWGNAYVKKFKLKVAASLKTLAVTPYLYAVAEEQTQVRKCVLHKNCSMLYGIYDHTVLIICFWDNRQDPLLLS
ncbi:type II toxin-antitoxin system RelE/ParE family toxin [Mucilaginibacter sp. AW1-7]|jgi:plasmid stabilization system protein ParE|uniref:type II toxin-antitoxin system RelE/ParE family toxin n=1 Tax=Mucilaginibacter sp. AW1-7 TaxID=3349874 RepID=UPI003F73B6AC